jgi:hypothetical protein
MRVHRHLHDKQGSVYAFRSDLDAWARGRLGRHTADDPAPEPVPGDPVEDPKHTAVAAPSVPCRSAATPGSVACRSGDPTRGCRPDNLAGASRPLIERSDNCALPATDRLPWQRTGGGLLARWPVRRLSVGSRRKNGRLGHAGRDREVLQPHARSGSKPTILKLLAELGNVCTRFQDAAIRDVRSKRIECDEIWQFCYAKQKNVPEDKRGTFGYGDVWTWTALDSDSKLIVSWLVGSRDSGAATEFMQDVASRLAIACRSRRTATGRI